MMDDLQKRRTRGREAVREMFSEEFLAGYEGTMNADFGADLARMALEFAFAETWGNPALSRKSRSFIMIGALVAMGKRDELIKHMQAGLNNGITIDELEQAVLQVAPYCGFPAAGLALECARHVLKERGLLPRT